MSYYTIEWDLIDIYFTLHTLQINQSRLTEILQQIDLKIVFCFVLSTLSYLL